MSATTCIDPVEHRQTILRHKVCRVCEHAMGRAATCSLNQRGCGDNARENVCPDHRFPGQIRPDATPRYEWEASAGEGYRVTYPLGLPADDWFGLVTSASKAYSRISELTLPGKVEYARRHGYALSFIELAKDCRLSRVESWLPFAKGAASEWTLFTGSDVLLTNLTTPLDSLADERYDFIIGLDHNGINNDVFLMRSCAACVEYLESVLDRMRRQPWIEDQDAMAHFIPEVPGLRQAMPETTGHWTPRASPGFATKVIHQRSMNAYLYGHYHYYSVADSMVPDPQDSFVRKCGTWQPGDFALHLPGMNNSDRIDYLKTYAPMVVR